MNSTLPSSYVSSAWQRNPNFKTTTATLYSLLCWKRIEASIRRNLLVPSEERPHTYNLSSVKLEEISQLKYSSLRRKAQRGKASTRRSGAVGLTCCCRSSRKEEKKERKEKKKWLTPINLLHLPCRRRRKRGGGGRRECGAAHTQ